MCDLAEDADDERGQADDDAAVGLGLLRVPDEAYGDDAEQYRHEQVEPAEGAGHQHLDEIADRAAQVRPGAGGDDQREAEQQQREAVLAVRRVEALRRPALCRGTSRRRRGRCPASTARTRRYTPLVGECRPARASARAFGRAPSSRSLLGAAASRRGLLRRRLCGRGRLLRGSSWLPDGRGAMGGGPGADALRTRVPDCFTR